MKRLVVLVGLAAVLVSAAACNGSTGGQATPQTTTGGGTSSPIPTSDGGTTLPVDQACSLLSSTDLEQLAASAPPTQEMVGTAPSCSFDSADFSMVVAIRTNAGLPGFTSTGGTVQDTTVGRHQAKQEADTTSGSCAIGIGVSPSSRVDVTVQAILSGDPCPAALKLATLIEPKLP